MGIEPTRPAWKAGILPLNYTRIENVLIERLYMITHFLSFVKGFCDIFFKTFHFFERGKNSVVARRKTHPDVDSLY